MKKTLSVLTIGLAMTMSGVAFAQAIPADKATVKIDSIPGEKGAVELAHAKHANELKGPGGKDITCKSCHHTLKADAPAAGEKVAACSSCHVVDTPKTVDGKQAPVLATMKGPKADLKSVLLHKTCKDGCHKDMKAEGKSITSCTTCHKK